MIHDDNFTLHARCAVCWQWTELHALQPILNVHLELQGLNPKVAKSVTHSDRRGLSTIVEAAHHFCSCLRRRAQLLPNASRYLPKLCF